MDFFGKKETAEEIFKKTLRVVYASGGVTTKGMKVLNVGGKNDGEYRANALDITIIEGRPAFGPVFDYLSGIPADKLIGGKVAIQGKAPADPKKMWITFPDQIAFKPNGAKAWKTFKRQTTAAAPKTIYMSPEEEGDSPF